ncbi:MAG: YidC/Oxa1 family rane protein insertase [Thermoleophilaceae bacterium]|jgi:YidC/Oxa1 family membrane protein insertase|nr:YidC/Oxa1 family rane protein insertase [Thermoleophilaceae bacterium]
MIFADIPVLQPLIDLCEVILVFFHGLVGSWGVAIILMTVTIRLAILPLTFRGVKGMQEMQRLQPEMKKLQERYKDDKQRLQQETMAMYKEHGVNPLASCFPLLLQLPFFLALFYMLRTDLKADMCPGITPYIAEHHLQLANVSCSQVPNAPDPSFLFIPDLTASATGITLAVLVLLYVGSQLGSSLVSTATADPTQRRIFLALPIVFGVFIIISPFPSGLLVYWITTNLWTVGQQLAVRKIYPKPPALDLPDPESKPARGKPPASGAASPASGNGSSKAPPGNPRKRKKRSGRRR